MKRYLAEEGSRLVRELMHEADGWFMCRVGYVETVRASSWLRAAGPRAVCTTMGRLVGKYVQIAAAASCSVTLCSRRSS